MSAFFRQLKFTLIRGIFFIFFFTSAFLTGCATPSGDKGLSMAGHKVFEVDQVLNETGQTFDPDITSRLTGLIRSKLREKEFNVSEKPEGAIIIRSSITSFETKSARTQCTVKTKFIDKSNQIVLDEVVTSKTISVGGLSYMNLNSDQAILESVANDIVFELERRIKSEPQLSR